MSDVNLSMIVVLAILSVTVVIVAAVIALARTFSDRKQRSSTERPGYFQWLFTPDWKKAGIRGEQIAIEGIQPVLHGDDRLYTNISIEFDGRSTELDCVIVNRFGVFIIETKNYAGRLTGSEEDFEWHKYKTTDAGNTYVKTVKNPIRQVKRQIYLLSRYLDYYGVDVWIKGYAILLQNNSPVESDMILTSPEDVDKAIHTRGRVILSKGMIENIDGLLTDRL